MSFSTFSSLWAVNRGRVPGDGGMGVRVGVLILPSSQRALRLANKMGRMVPSTSHLNFSAMQTVLDSPDLPRIGDCHERHVYSSRKPHGDGAIGLGWDLKKFGAKHDSDRLKV